MLTPAQAIETTRVHRVAGLTGDRTALVTTRPFWVPHHTISDVGLIGGGHLPRPGEGSRAHHGMLFLDERPEFGRHVLEVLHQPLEEFFPRIDLTHVIDTSGAYIPGHGTPIVILSDFSDT